MKLILASGKHAEFVFPLITSVGDVTEYVYNNWPEGKWIHIRKVDQFSWTFWSIIYLILHSLIEAVDYLRIHWRLLTILKTSNKSVWNNVFWYVKVCIFWKCIQYTIHWDKTQIFNKISSWQNKRYKKCPLFSVASSNSSQFYF